MAARRLTCNSLWREPALRGCASPPSQCPMCALIKVTLASLMQRERFSVYRSTRSPSNPPISLDMLLIYGTFPLMGPPGEARRPMGPNGTRCDPQGPLCCCYLGGGRRLYSGILNRGHDQRGKRGPGKHRGPADFQRVRVRRRRTYTPCPTRQIASVLIPTISPGCTDLISPRIPR
jgi:hypothetical protein